MGQARSINRGHDQKGVSVNLFHAKRILATSGAIGIIGACLTLASEASACDSPPKAGDPVITKASIVGPTTIDVAGAPGQPKLAVTYTVGPSGLGGIEYTFASASTTQSFFGDAYFDDSDPGSGTVDLLNPSPGFNTSDGSNGGFNLYSAPGLWNLTELAIYDEANHCTDYAGAALNALMPHHRVTVVNSGAPETKGPTIATAKILTPTVSRSAAYPFIRLSLEVEDAVSGVEAVAANFSNAGETYSIGAYSDPVAPVHKGVMVAGERLESSTLTGKYRVTQIIVCNVAGACITVSGAKLSALFGGKTSFTVTK
jgi:hypothetical protein